jgi:hypothetical protein
MLMSEWALAAAVLRAGLEATACPALAMESDANEND